ncbi:hypothetical protein [Massilia sp. SYSU DXS3249]
MTLLLRRLAPIAALLLAILASVLAGAPASAGETGMPHLIHEHEGWAALAVVVASLAAAACLLVRALRR